MTRRTGLWAALLAAAATVTVAVLVLTGHHSASPATRAADLSGQLRCPSCAGESVADSNSPIARSMRREVAAQVDAGRSDDQVLSWFRARYGDDVVMSPPLDGVGWLLWGGPVVALLAAVGVVVAQRRRRDAPVDAPAVQGPGPALPLRRLGVALLALGAVGAGVPLAVAATGDRGGMAADVGPGPAAAEEQQPPAARWAETARQLDDRGRLDDALRAWRRAHELAPDSVPVTTRLAFDLVRQGRAHHAISLVRRAATRPGPDRPLALLVLGLAQRDLHRPAAAQTLRRFLRVAPDHQAAGQVRRLLREEP